LYVLFDNEVNGQYVNQLIEFVPGATSGNQLLANVPMFAFTVDQRGDIYAAIQGTSSSTAGAIEVFPAGSSTPSDTIAGLNTGITDGVSQIVLPR
jgi:hypothetical protein